MRENQIEQAAGIAPLDLDLPQRADVDDAGTFANRAVLLFDAENASCTKPQVGMTILLGRPTLSTSKRSVIPTGAQRSGGTCCFFE